MKIDVGTLIIGILIGFLLLSMANEVGEKRYSKEIIQCVIEKSKK